MTRKLKRKYPGLGGMVACSLLCHTLGFLAISYSGLFPRYQVSEEPVYYVDMVNLPVAAPQTGSPAAPGTAPKPQPPAAEPSEMQLPRKNPEKQAPLPPKTAPRAPAAPAAKGAPPASQQLDEAREFEDRMSRIQRDAEARHEAAALEALKRKVASNRGKAGMPSATGREAGSDYASYLQSRLRDAFRNTIAFQTRNPQMKVRIIVARNGRVSSFMVESSTGDKLFEESVFRAIARAEKGFTPPPGGAEVEQGFVFRPQGVGLK